MTTLEVALVDPEMYAPCYQNANDNEPDEGAIDDPDQMQFLYLMECNNAI